ncbi:MAG: hypothetical protein ACWA5P_06665 [bacterium]
MKVSYNETSQSIEIKDGLKKQYLLLKFLMILNLFNAIMRLVNKEVASYKFLEYAWVFVGVISLVALFMFVFRLSALENIPIDEITNVEDKTYFGKRRFAFILKNGKKRNLGSFKSEQELADTLELFDRLSLKN